MQTSLIQLLIITSVVEALNTAASFTTANEDLVSENQTEWRENIPTSNYFTDDEKISSSPQEVSTTTTSQTTGTLNASIVELSEPNFVVDRTTIEDFSSVAFKSTATRETDSVSTENHLTAMDIYTTETIEDDDTQHVTSITTSPMTMSWNISEDTTKLTTIEDFTNGAATSAITVASTMEHGVTNTTEITEITENLTTEILDQTDFTKTQEMTTTTSTTNEVVMESLETEMPINYTTTEELSITGWIINATTTKTTELQSTLSTGLDKEANTTEISKITEKRTTESLNQSNSVGNFTAKLKFTTKKNEVAMESLETEIPMNYTTTEELSTTNVTTNIMTDKITRFDEGTNTTDRYKTTEELTTRYTGSLHENLTTTSNITITNEKKMESLETETPLSYTTTEELSTTNVTTNIMTDKITRFDEGTNTTDRYKTTEELTTRYTGSLHENLTTTSNITITNEKKLESLETETPLSYTTTEEPFTTRLATNAMTSKSASTTNKVIMESAETALTVNYTTTEELSTTNATTNFMIEKTTEGLTTALLNQINFTTTLKAMTTSWNISEAASLEPEDTTNLTTVEDFTNAATTSAITVASTMKHGVTTTTEITKTTKDLTTEILDQSNITKKFTAELKPTTANEVVMKSTETEISINYNTTKEPSTSRFTTNTVTKRNTETEKVPTIEVDKEANTTEIPKATEDLTTEILDQLNSSKKFTAELKPTTANEVVMKSTETEISINYNTTKEPSTSRFTTNTVTKRNTETEKVPTIEVDEEANTTEIPKTTEDLTTEILDQLNTSKKFTAELKPTTANEVVMKSTETKISMNYNTTKELSTSRFTTNTVTKRNTETEKVPTIEVDEEAKTTKIPKITEDLTTEFLDQTNFTADVTTTPKPTTTTEVVTESQETEQARRYRNTEDLSTAKVASPVIAQSTESQTALTSENLPTTGNKTATTTTTGATTIGTPEITSDRFTTTANSTTASTLSETTNAGVNTTSDQFLKISATAQESYSANISSSHPTSPVVLVSESDFFQTTDANATAERIYKRKLTTGTVVTASVIATAAVALAVSTFGKVKAASCLAKVAPAVAAV